jgi:hypothetical protein
MWTLLRISALVAIIGFFVHGMAVAQAHTAGLVVIKGDGSSIWVAVPFDEESISGADLLERSGLAVTEVSFGGMGIAICGIEQTGCDVAECRKRLCQGPGRDDPYWQNYLAGDEGTWVVAPLGISSDRIHDGDVRGLIWSADPPSIQAPDVEQVAAKVGSSQGEARFDYEGNPTTETTNDSSSIPWVGISITAGLAITMVGIALMRRRGRRQLP